MNRPLVVPMRVHIARLLDRLSGACKRGADGLYRRHSRIEARKAQAQIERDRELRHRRDALAVDDLLADVARKTRHGSHR